MPKSSYNERAEPRGLRQATSRVLIRAFTSKNAKNRKKCAKTRKKCQKIVKNAKKRKSLYNDSARNKKAWCLPSFGFRLASPYRASSTRPSLVRSSRPYMHISHVFNGVTGPVSCRKQHGPAGPDKEVLCGSQTVVAPAPVMTYVMTDE